MSVGLLSCGIGGPTFIANVKPKTFVFGGDFKLDEEGFHYKGELIKDNGKAYNAFMEFMEKANNPIMQTNQAAENGGSDGN